MDWWVNLIQMTIYFYYSGQESLRRNGVALTRSQQKSPKCSTWVQSQKWPISVCFQGKPFNITVNQVYAPTRNAEEAEVEWFCEDLQDLLELTPKKDVLFIIGDWNAKVGHQEIPGVTGKFGLGMQRIDVVELWCWRRLLRVPWTARRSNQSILKEISPEYSLERLMLKLKLQYFGHLMTHWKKPWSWERLKAGEVMVGWHHQLNGQEFEQAPEVGDGQGSLPCCSPWGCRVGHDWATELNWKGVDIKSSHHKRKNL